MIHGSMQTFSLTLDAIFDHAAKWHPDTEVVTARGDGAFSRLGYADLKLRAQRLSALLAGAGAKTSDHVATLAWNTQGHVEAWWAIMGMGAVCHTLNPRLTPEQLAWMLDQSGARILIVSADLQSLAARVAELALGLDRVFVTDGEPEGEPGRLTFQSMASHLENTTEIGRWGAFDETSPCGLCFTSGSTGAPKGVTYTHRASFLHALKLMSADVLGSRTTDTVMPIVPLFHANAWGLPLAAPAAGSRLVLPGRHLDGASLARAIMAENVTVAVGVPTVFLGLCEHLEASHQSVPSLRRIVLGGAPTPPALMERLQDQLGVEVQNSWGMTELTPVGVFSIVGDPDSTAIVSGRPSVGVDLMLMDADGKPLPQQRETEGRLHVRGAAVIERYFDQTEPVVDADGWFDTGDLARIDAKGNLIITGRAKDLIKSGGEWINPSEIETLVCELPEVALAAVIGRPDPKWSERPILLVEMRDGLDLSDDDILSSLKGKIASWWMPDAVIRLPAMPLASTGKIDKLALRSTYSVA